MKNLFAVLAALAALIGFIPAVSGQGSVTYTKLSSVAQLDDLITQSIWLTVFDIQHGGQVSLMHGPEYADYMKMDGTVTNTYSSSLSAAYLSDITLAEHGGTVSVSSTIENGRFNTAGYTAGTSMACSESITGIVIAILNPDYLTYPQFNPQQIVSDLNIGSSYESTVADSTGKYFDGLICTLDAPTSEMDISFKQASPDGSADGLIYVLALGPSTDTLTVPEPSTYALIGLGLLGGQMFRHYRPRTSAPKQRRFLYQLFQTEQGSQ